MSLTKSPGFCEHSFLYNKLGDLSAEEFASFIDQENHVSRLVIIHILVLDFVMSRRVVDEEGKAPDSSTVLRSGYDCRKSMAVIWIQKVVDQLPQEYLPYATWALSFSKQLMDSFEGASELWKPFLYTLPTATGSAW